MLGELGEHLLSRHPGLLRQRCLRLDTARADIVRVAIIALLRK
jgi:hypothetical protein